MSPELIYWLAILLFLVGFIAFLLEVFIFVGFGFAGFLGIIFVGWGILLLSVDVTQMTASLAISIAITIIFLVVGLRLMSRYKMWYNLTLQNRQQNKEGYVAPAPELSRYAGMEGLAMTPLRPAGTADIGGSRLDVVTEGEFIPRGAHVKVIKVEGLRVVVKEKGNLEVKE